MTAAASPVPASASASASASAATAPAEGWPPETLHGYTLRPARPADVPALVGLIGELAEFEHLTHLLEVTAEKLHPHLFGDRPVAEAMVAEHDGGTVVAFALTFTNFSTFLAKPGLYLEDLYVQPAHRGAGLGQRMLTRLARLAIERGHGRFEWCVLDWNADAIRFYERMGATILPDWRMCRLTGEALAAFGRAAP